MEEKRKTSNYNLSTKGKNSDNLIDNVCDKHNDKLSFFCLQDLVFVCQQCLLYGIHKNHKFLNQIDIKNRCNDINSKIYLDLEDIQNHFNETIKIKKEFLSQLNEKKNENIKSIDHFYNILIEELIKNKEDFISKVNNYYSNFEKGGEFYKNYNKFEKIVSRKLISVWEISKNIKLNFGLFMDDKYLEKNFVFRENLIYLKSEINEHKDKILKNLKLKLIKVKNENDPKILFSNFSNFNKKFLSNILNLDGNKNITNNDKNKKNINNFTFINISESFIDKNLDNSIENSPNLTNVENDSIINSKESDKLDKKYNSTIYDNTKCKRNKSFLKNNKTVLTKFSNSNKSSMINLKNQDLDDKSIINILKEKRKISHNTKEINISYNQKITHNCLAFIIDEFLSNKFPSLENINWDYCYNVNVGKIKNWNNGKLSGLKVFLKNVRIDKHIFDYSIKIIN